jgi:hypothetical protein
MIFLALAAMGPQLPPPPESAQPAPTTIFTIGDNLLLEIISVFVRCICCLSSGRNIEHTLNIDTMSGALSVFSS